MSYDTPGIRLNGGSAGNRLYAYRGTSEIIVSGIPEHVLVSQAEESVSDRNANCQLDDLGERGVSALSLYSDIQVARPRGFTFHTGGAFTDGARLFGLSESDPLRDLFCDWLCASAGEMCEGEMDKMVGYRVEDYISSGHYNHICEIGLGRICRSCRASGVCCC